MPRCRFHGLKRPKVRQDWSKENLYNLSRMSAPRADGATFFQQKWRAKALTRAFHGPQVREGQWTRMFDRRLPAVVPMSHEYLAKNDGSEMAGGRGSGADLMPDRASDGLSKKEMGQGHPARKTPYMHMTYGPMERRLDTAIWRALFASSVRQARQFVVHGWVTVNGKKMIYPGYQLNPGDMFAVDPERVMYATGARKRSQKDPNSVQHVREQAEQDRIRAQARAKAKEREAEAATSKEPADASIDSAETPADKSRKALKQLFSRAERILDDSKQSLSGKRLQDLREFSRNVKRTMGKIRVKTESSEKELAAVDTTIDGLERAFAEILVKIPDEIATLESESTATSPSSQPAPSSSQATSSPKNDPSSPAEISRQARLVHRLLQRANENPIDPSKPYATPWRPREFMPAFAFIPRYLEVNQNICSAVYLRHPVARPGLAEIPTPFNGDTMALAFNWYLRRR